MEKIPNGLSIKHIAEHYPEELASVIREASSISNILHKLGLQSTNNRARGVLKTFAQSKGLSLPTYIPELHPANASRRLSKEEVLKRFVKGDKHLGSGLSKIARKYDLLEYECQGEECQLIDGMWGSVKVEYQLDHINGDNTDNRLENLRFLCVMCHSLTDTYAGKNAKNSAKNIRLNKCLDCDFLVQKKLYCDEHFSVARDRLMNNTPSIETILLELKSYSVEYLSKKYFMSRTLLTNIKNSPLRYEKYPRRQPTTDYPSLEILTQMLKGNSFESVARQIGVSSNAIRKHLKNSGIVLNARRRPNGTFSEKDYLCNCGNKKQPTSLQCNNCLRLDLSQLADSRLPEVNEVTGLIKEIGITKAASTCGVSRKTVYEFLARHNIDYRNL